MLLCHAGLLDVQTQCYGDIVLTFYENLHTNGLVEIEESVLILNKIYIRFNVQLNVHGQTPQ